MSARELNEWFEFYNLEPFGEVRDNWHMAVVAHILANANRRPSAPPAKISDFMHVDPETARERREQAVIAWFEQHSEPN